MTRNDAVIIAASEPFLAPLIACGNSFNRPYDLFGVPRFSRSSLSDLEGPLRGAFVVNPPPTWSLKRLHREVSEHTSGATLAVCFVHETKGFGAPVDAMRWLASTPEVFADSPTSWATEHVTCSISTNTDAPALARQFVRSALRQWQRPGAIESATLAASELVTNAVLHSRRPSVDITIAAALSQSGVQLVVADEAMTHLPIRRRPTTTSRSGRGLRIVDAVTTHWGITVTPTQKRVWCEIDETDHHERGRCGGNQELSDVDEDRRLPLGCAGASSFR